MTKIIYISDLDPKIKDFKYHFFKINEDDNLNLPNIKNFDIIYLGFMIRNINYILRNKLPYQKIHLIISGGDLVSEIFISLDFSKIDKLFIDNPDWTNPLNIYPRIIKFSNQLSSRIDWIPESTRKILFNQFIYIRNLGQKNKNIINKLKFHYSPKIVSIPKSKECSLYNIGFENYHLPNRGILQCLQIFERLLKSNPKYNLYLFGKRGVLGDMYIIKKMNKLKSNIKLVGSLDELYSSVGIILSTSYIQSDYSQVIRARATGKHIVVLDKFNFKPPNIETYNDVQKCVNVVDKLVKESDILKQRLEENKIKRGNKKQLSIKNDENKIKRGEFEYIENQIKNNNYQITEEHIKQMNDFAYDIDNRWTLDFKNIIYLKVDLKKYGKFYIDKQDLYINILKKLGKNIENITLGQYLKNFHTNPFKLESYKNKVYIFDELSYNHMVWRYNEIEGERSKILTFCKNSNYIIITSELFENDNLRTIGMKSDNIEFAECFFKNAYKIIISNTRNINYLIKAGVNNKKIYYHPTISYSKILNHEPLIQDGVQDIDILFYGNLIDKSENKDDWINYRYHTILSKLEKWNKYKLIIKAPHTNYGELFDEEKDSFLKRTKIVLHTPSFKNLHTFPWAKLWELMYKKVFFIIEENEEIYYRNLQNLIAFYKRSNLESLKQKIQYYLNNPNERNIIVERCYNYITSTYNMDNLFSNKYKICYFNFNDNSYHNNQKQFILNILNKEFLIENKLDIKFNTPLNNDYYDFIKNYKKNENEIFIFNAYDFWTIIHSITPLNIKEVVGFLKNTNYIYFGYEVLKNIDLEQIGLNISKYNIVHLPIRWFEGSIQKVDMASYQNINLYTNKIRDNIKKYCIEDVRINTISKTKFWCSWMEKYDNFKNIEIVEYIDVFVKKKKKIIKEFYLNAKYIYTSIHDNIDYLQHNNIKNLKYFPPMSYSEENNFKPIQQTSELIYDIIFYGNYINSGDALPYRANIWDKVKKYSKINKIVYQEYDGNLTNDIKDEILAQTKIVLHIPSYPNLKHFPWQKTMELICKKIFIIIEECQDMYKLNLDKFIVFYKSGDIDDLNKKISYYLANPKERKNITDKLFELIKDTYNLNDELKRIINL